MSEPQKPTRRKFMAAAAGATVAAAVGGFFGGWASAPKEVSEAQVRTVTQTITPETPSAGTVPSVVKEPVKLGLTYPMTGWFDKYGLHMYHGAVAAVEEINAGGGILGRKAEYILGDVQNYETEVVNSTVEKMITIDKVNALGFGFWGGLFYPQPASGAGVAAKYGVPYLVADTTTATPELILKEPDNYPYLWQLDPVEATYSMSYERYATMLMRGDMGATWTPPHDPPRVAFIRGEGYYPQRIADSARAQFERGTYGGVKWDLMYDETATVGTIEWGPTLAKLRANPPDLIVFTTLVTADNAAFCTQFLENPTKTLLLFTYAGELPENIELIGPEIEGMLWGCNSSLRLMEPFAHSYYVRLRQRWDAEMEKLGWLLDHAPGGCAYTYDSIWWYKAHAEAGGSIEPESIRQAWLRAAPLRGLCGGYDVDWKSQTVRGYVPGGDATILDMYPGEDHPNWTALTEDPSRGLSVNFYQYQKPFSTGTVSGYPVGAKDAIAGSPTADGLHSEWIGPWPYQSAPFKLPKWWERGAV